MKTLNYIDFVHLVSRIKLANKEIEQKLEKNHIDAKHKSY